ncbi:hypothetical protein Psta_3713 [Pirellula staleyi DSM 6068]|uniref:Uncharacterized protein n=1 Tax=Pirellula staleyi (strain ATCC 27377 / DSM 6068 / ICPB 4128) TaxID=530564 RepID=D2R003_PIRSD|nr:hypothetical protein Psta_3713 [Pirellula staleyi DSM 6068]
MVSPSLSLYHGVRFASLTTEMHLMSGASAKLDLLHRHLLIRLAGNVAEMIYTIQRFRSLGHDVNWTRWRSRRLRNLYRRSEADNDWGYAAIISWSDSKNAAEVCASLDSH